MADFVDVLASELSRRNGKYYFLESHLREALTRCCLRLVPDPDAQLAVDCDKALRDRTRSTKMQEILLEAQRRRAGDEAT